MISVSSETPSVSIGSWHHINGISIHHTDTVKSPIVEDIFNFDHLPFLCDSSYDICTGIIFYFPLDITCLGAIWTPWHVSIRLIFEQFKKSGILRYVVVKQKWETVTSNKNKITERFKLSKLWMVRGKAI